MSWAEEAFAPVYAEYRRQVEASTWGHLAPKKNKKYPGEMFFCKSEYGDYVLIRTRWEGLEDSPWLFDAMMDFIEEVAQDRDGEILRWRGTFRNYCFTGSLEVLT